MAETVSRRGPDERCSEAPRDRTRQVGAPGGFVGLPRERIDEPTQVLLEELRGER